MFDFQEKRKIRGWVYSKVTIVILFVLVILTSISVVERFKVEREMVEKREEKEQELQALKQRASLLESKVEHLKDSRGVEEELRNRFDVAKEGEQVVVIVGKEGEQKNIENLGNPPGTKEPVSFWLKVKQWFDL